MKERLRYQHTIPTIWLESGFESMRTPYGEAYRYAALDQIQPAILVAILSKPARLEPKEIQFLRTYLDCTQAEIANDLNVSDQTVSLWERDAGHRIPVTSDFALRQFVCDVVGKEILTRCVKKTSREWMRSIRPEANYHWVGRFEDGRWHFRGEIVPQEYFVAAIDYEADSSPKVLIKDGRINIRRVSLAVGDNTRHVEPFREQMHADLSGGTWTSELRKDIKLSETIAESEVNFAFLEAESASADVTPTRH